MKRDNYKTKKQLVDELAQMRQRVAELVKSEVEHKQAEEELRESERRYRLLVEDARDVIWTVDMNMRPTYISPSITPLLGYGVEEAMALPMEVVYAPASFETAMKIVAEELAIEDMEQKDLYRSRTLELELNRKDGSIVPVEGRFTFVRGPDGRPIAILAIVRDITERKWAEEKLREETEKLQALVDGLTSTGIAIDIVSNDYKILLQNQVLVERFGDCAGKICYEEYIELEAPCDICPMREAIKNNRVESAELTGADGRSYEIFSAPLANPDGSVDRAIEVIMDITERKRAEERLQQSEENLRAYLESAPDGIYINDLKGTFLYGNKKAEEIAGYKREELVGKSFLNLKILPGKHLAKAGKLLALNVMGKPTGPDEFEMIRKDGSHVWVEINTIPIKQQESTVVVGFVRDITERKKAEEERLAALRKAADVIEAMGDAVAIVDFDGTIRQVNSEFERGSGWKREEVIGKTNVELGIMSEVESQRVEKELIPKFMKENFVQNFETISKRRDGTEFPILISWSLLKDAHDKPIGIVTVARDITERKKMEEQLIVADRLASIGELSSGLAHELNNPLTGIILLSELLLAKDLPDDVREDLKVIDRELQRTAGIARNLLTFARKHETEKQAVNINDIIEKVLELRAYEQKGSNIEVNTRFAPALPEIMADGFLLQQAFINIIINAEHFMIEAHNKGTLTITTKRVGNIVRASFVDDGPGITQENLGHLFDPFFTTKEVGKGTGLGLSICHGVITEHGGRIYAESELGKGATFIVELPIVEH